MVVVLYLILLSYKYSLTLSLSHSLSHSLGIIAVVYLRYIWSYATNIIPTISTADIPVPIPGSPVPTPRS